MNDGLVYQIHCLPSSSSVVAGASSIIDTQPTKSVKKKVLADGIGDDVTKTGIIILKTPAGKLEVNFNTRAAHRSILTLSVDKRLSGPTYPL